MQIARFDRGEVQEVVDQLQHELARTPDSGKESESSSVSTVANSSHRNSVMDRILPMGLRRSCAAMPRN